MKKLAIFIMSLLMFVGVLAPATVVNAKTNDINVTYTLKDNKKQIAKKTVTLKSDSTVLQGVKKEWKVKESGKTVTSIKGCKKDGKTWTYTVNGEKCSVDPNKQTLKNNDKIVYTLK